jgi:hypothetical protein
MVGKWNCPVMHTANPLLIVAATWGPPTPHKAQLKSPEKFSLNFAFRPVFLRAIFASPSLNQNASCCGRVLTPSCHEHAL